MADSKLYSITSTRNITVDLSKIIKMAAESLTVSVVHFYFAETIHNLGLDNEMVVFDEKGERVFSTRLNGTKEAYATFAFVSDEAAEAVIGKLEMLAAGLEAELEEARTRCIVDCKFAAVDDGGKRHVVSATFDPSTGKIESATDSHEAVVAEEFFIEFEDGRRFDVCPVCSSQVLDRNGYCTGGCVVS